MRSARMLLPLVLLFAISIAWAQRDSIEGLVKQLHSDKKQVRLHAVHALGRRGHAAGAAVPQLVKLLDEQNLDLRLEVVAALGKIGRHPEQVVPAVAQLLSSKSGLLRHAALDCLNEFHAEAKSAAPQLKHLLSDPEQIIQITAARTLISLTPNDHVTMAEAARVLTKGLESDDSNLAKESISGLIEIGPTVVPGVVKALSSNHSRTLVHACDTLGALGSRAAVPDNSVVPALIKVSAASDADARQHAIDALGAIGAHPELVVPVLKRALSDNSATVRSHAARSLADFGKAGAPAVPELIHALQDADRTVRETVAESLGRMGPAAEMSVPALVLALNDPEASVTVLAAEALGKIGKASVHPLIEKLNDANYQLLAATVLASIGADAVEAAPALTNLIQAKDDATVREALLALGSIGSAAKKDAGEKVLKLLNDATSPHRAAAAFALGRMKVVDAADSLKSVLQSSDDATLQLASARSLLELDGNEANLQLALPKLSNALTSMQEGIRIEAAAALGRVGPAAKSSVPALRKAMLDKNQDVQVEVMLALAAIGPDSHPAVPEIVAQLQGASPEIREVACHTLGRIGPAAKEAVPALRKLLHSHNRDEQTDGAWALALISPDAETSKIAIPLVVGVLQSPAPPSVRADAARDLGQFGGHSTEVRNALQSALKDPSEAVRQAAQTALGKLK